MSNVTQMFYAVTDPNWGEPRVIPETVRTSTEFAVDTFLRMREYGLYTGASEFPLPNGTKGNMTRATEQGFKVVTFKLDPAELEVV